MPDFQTLKQSLDALPQPEASAALDRNIMSTVQKLLTLEQYHKADSLLHTQHARLDEQTRLNLQTGMSALKEQYGSGFDLAYSHFVAQQNAVQNHQKDEPEYGRG